MHSMMLWPQLSGNILCIRPVGLWLARLPIHYLGHESDPTKLVGGNLSPSIDEVHTDIN